MAPGGRWLLDHLWPPPADELSDLTDKGPREVFRIARKHGWSVSEASNLAAYVVGLPLSSGESGFKQPWTMPTLYHLLFLKRLYELGTWSPIPIARRRRGSARGIGRIPTHDRPH